MLYVSHAYTHLPILPFLKMQVIMCLRKLAPIMFMPHSYTLQALPARISARFSVWIVHCALLFHTGSLVQVFPTIFLQITSHHLDT